MATKFVQIVQDCTVTLEDGSQQKLQAGRHELDEDVADHWFVRAHSDNPPAPQLKAGTPEYAMAAAKERQRRKIVDAAVEEAAEEEVRPHKR